MQKIFIIKEVCNPRDDVGNFSKVNEFIGKTGTIISVTAFGITSSVGGETNANNDRIAGRCLVVADDGKGQDVSL